MTVLQKVFLTSEIEGIWEKVAVDLRWNVTVDDYQRLLALGEAMREDHPAFLAKWKNMPSMQRSKKGTFADLVKGCRMDVLEAHSKDLFGTEANKQIEEQLLDPLKYGQLPCCEIVAGMCAARVYQGGKIREHDVLDFIHASAGVPCCQAYFCDGPMEHLLRKKPLQIENYFDATIRSRPEDLLAYLESIKVPKSV